MLKLSRMLPSSSSRNHLFEVLSSRKIEFQIFSTATNHYSAKVSGYSSDRVFAPYSVYKGKAAFSLTPCLPTFTKLDSGALVVDRRGSIMMSFVPAVGERKYDWEKRQRFALSATEVGSVIAIGPQDSCEFFHDPSMKSSNAGQVRKSLSIKPHSSGYFVSLTVVNSVLNTKDNFSVPVTTAEFSVMKTACSQHWTCHETDVSNGGAMAAMTDGLVAMVNIGDITGFSTIIHYNGAAKRPVWWDFGSPPWTVIHHRQHNTPCNLG